MADKGAILLASGDWDPEPWADAVRRFDPARSIAIWPDRPNPDAIRYVMAWKPPVEAFRALSGLQAIFSLGAGVEHIVGLDPLPDVPIVRVVNEDLTGRITEWVVLQVLLHHRRQLAYLDLQRRVEWKELRQPAANEVRVGILGLGVLGRDSARILVEMGFQVAGWSRSPKAVSGIDTFSGSEGLNALLARTDILISLLPLTPDTDGILAMPLFEKLDGGALGAPVLINAGRGGLQVEADIARALAEGTLGGASLDVFEVEPLPPESPLWSAPDLVITPHCAGWSNPEALVRQMLEQIAAFEAGESLANVVDRTAGY